MKAVQWRDGAIVVAEVPEPSGDGALVRIRAAGICGSDLAMIGTGFGVIPGHELAGTLDDGTPVAIEPIGPCERCDQCRAGQPQRCRTGPDVFGATRDGGMAEWLRVPARAPVPLPAGLGLGDACLVEPMAVALHGLRSAGFAAGQRVGIIGGGTIGLCAAAIAAQHGCDVAVTARHPHQRAAAEALGARPVLDNAYENAHEGECDIVLEAAGTESAVAAAADACAPGGTIVVLGTHHGVVPLPFVPSLLKELRVVVSFTYGRDEQGRDVEAAARFLAADRSVAGTLITHRFPLDDAAHAFRVAAARDSGAIKVVLEP